MCYPMLVMEIMTASGRIRGRAYSSSEASGATPLQGRTKLAQVVDEPG
jgi:hypothetical protein